MDLNDYQAAAERTAKKYDDPQSTDRQVMTALALAGEVGELCNLMKKKFAHGHEIPDAKFADELGDIQWYVAVLASAFGLSLDSVAKENIGKLEVRYPEGFSQEASINRKA